MLASFKANVLGPLLRGERPTGTVPLTLFAAEINDPLHYLFESDRWDEVIGASKRLARAGEKLRAVLSADGYSGDDLLHVDNMSVLGLVHDRGMAERWAEAVERVIALETDIVTVSTLVYPVTAEQVVGGLYRSPRAVIGVPGVNDYQERVNRYYGLSSPSTIPKEEAVARRRHFGEVVALARSLLLRARESRSVVPFYESLAFAERCVSCGVRPAEQLAGAPVCGVCLRKQDEGNPAKNEINSARGEISLTRGLSPLLGPSLSSSLRNYSALVWLEAVELDRLLEQQQTPLAYRRLYTEINEVLNLAVPGRLGTAALASGGGWQLLAIPATSALEAATSALEAITLHYGLKSPTTFVAAVVIGTVPDQCRALYELMRQTALSLRQASTDGESGESLLDVRILRPDRGFDQFRKPYTVDEARRLIMGVSTLRETPLPDNLLPQLHEQIARGNAGLYYAMERPKLSPAAQETLQRLEHTWNAGATPGIRFYALLADALALARVRD